MSSLYQTLEGGQVSVFLSDLHVIRDSHIVSGLKVRQGSARTCRVSLVKRAQGYDPKTKALDVV